MFGTTPGHLAVLSAHSSWLALPTTVRTGFLALGVFSRTLLRSWQTLKS